MPGKPKRTCLKPGCSELTIDKYCTKHQEERQQQLNEADKARGTAAQRGYSSQWRKARAGFLRKHPRCVHCMREGILTEATVVDHIIPHKGDKVLFWDRTNWQPLCKRHHDIKTVKEDGGFGNSRKTM